MDWLTSLYPVVRATLFEGFEQDWSELEVVFTNYTDDPIVSEVILPLAACRAVGGQAEDALPIAAAIVAAIVSLRLLDDLQDQDRANQLWEQVGTRRAWNYAAGLNQLAFSLLYRAPLHPLRIHSIGQVMSQALLRVSAGQDMILCDKVETLSAYWQSMELRTGQAYSAACAVGALVGSDDPDQIKNISTYGFHLGLVMQVFNDVEAIWSLKATDTVDPSRMSLPLLLGLHSPAPEADPLRKMVAQASGLLSTDKIREILDILQIRDYCVFLGLQEREKALAALQRCPNSDGKEALYVFITGLFGDLDELLRGKESAQ